MYILLMNRGSLHTRPFRRIRLSVFKYQLTKNDFALPQVFGAFEKRASGLDGVELIPENSTVA